MEMTYESMFEEITPSLYDLESMFWVVVAKDLYAKYGKKGEQAARAWIRRHANWRGAQIRKGHQALGVPCNVKNLFVYTDNPVNNAFIHLWKKEHKWTPYNLKLTVSPGECAMCDRMLEHDCGLLAATFCDELHQSFTTTYHPDAVVSVPNTMSKGDPQCKFQWVLPGDAKEPEPLPPYPGEDPLKDWQYDTEENIVKLGLIRMIRWYGAQIYFLREVLCEYFPENGDEEFQRLIQLWLEARVTCNKERKGELAVSSDPKVRFENMDLPYTASWDYDLERTGDGIKITVRYCPLEEVWSWVGDGDKVASYCDQCYQAFQGADGGACRCTVEQCRARGDKQCVITIKK